MKESKLNTITKLFDGKEIRSIWNSDEEDYYFSVVDVISALTDSNIPRRYWSDLKTKLIDEGSQLYENIVQLFFSIKKQCFEVDKVQLYEKIVHLNFIAKDSKIHSFTFLSLDMIIIKKTYLI